MYGYGVLSWSLSLSIFYFLLISLLGGNLANLIHNDSQRKLSLIMKYKIALDIARGLSFLHTKCFPPIIHRDLRTPNVFVCPPNSSNQTLLNLSFINPFILRHVLIS